MGAFLWWTTKSGEDKTLYFDLVVTESQDLTSTVTEHPVEDGANVSDHVQKELDKVTLEVFVSQTPIDDVNSRGGKVAKIPLVVQKYKPPLALTPGAAFAAVGGAIHSAVDALLGKKAEYAAQVLQWDKTFDAVADTQEALEKIRDDVQLVNVALPSKLYENMVLTKVSIIGDAGTGAGRTLSLDFTEIRRVQVRIVNAPKPTEPRAETKKSKGTQGAKTAPKGPAKTIALAAATEILPHLPEEVQTFFKGLVK